MRTTLLLLSLLILLASCSNQSTKSNNQTAISNAEKIQQLMSEAETSASPRKERNLIKAASLLLLEGQRDLAEEILASIGPQSLPLKYYERYARVYSRLYIQQGDYESAQLLLDSPQLVDNIYLLDTDTQMEISLLRAEVYALTGNHMASAQQRIFIASMLKRSQQIPNREAIWRSLMYISVDELERYKRSAFSEEYAAWLELALLAKESQGDLDEQLRKLDEWQQRHPNHPANMTLPGGLELIKELAANRPQQVALLLPTSGRLSPFGKAIRDGFIAAMYKTQQRGGVVPKIKVYDTELSDNIGLLYQQAVQEGAEMIVGPLEKNRTRLLFDEDITVPTLALNRIDNYGEAPSKLFQFGLAPQDEAMQIADIAFINNHRQAMIIAPKGDWGDKVSNSFNQRWQTLGGEVMAYSYFSGQEDYSSSIKQSLLLDDSEQRAKQIANWVGEPLEFTPRRRQDIDMVLLLARPQQARSLKPLLAYHYAGDLPVYGTSRLYTGYSDKSKDKDINGIQFIDMPWVLEKASPMRQQINQEIQESKQYQRMYALGIDSYHLHPRLRQLEEIPNSRVYGKTGTLKLNDQRQIERQMLLAQFKRSAAQIIPIADQDLTIDAAIKQDRITKDGDNEDEYKTLLQ